MYTKEDFLAAAAHEVKVIKHLYTKLPEGCLEYRPSEKQRSMRELLDYLPCNLSAIPETMQKGDWDNIRARMEKVQARAKEDFPAAMDEALAALTIQVQGCSEADLGKDASLPNGVVMPFGKGLLNFVLKFLVAYKMQFFLYLKACGRADLSSANCWMGMDPPPKP